MIQFFKILFLLIATCATSAMAQSQTAEVSVSTNLERDTILVGDQVLYSVVAKTPNFVKVHFPQITDSLGNGIDVIGNPSIDSIPSDGSVTYTMRMLVTAFDGGIQVIPELFFGLEHHGVIDTIYSPKRPFFVQLMPKDTTLTDICDIKPPMREPITFSEIAPWAGVAILVIAFVVLLVLYLKKRKENKPFLNIFKPSDPAHIVALRELNQMKEHKLWTIDNHKFYYTKLTDVLRAYLEGRFGIDAQEKTSSEILSDLRNLDYSFGSRFQQLEDLLFTADLVKFAKHLPLVTENEQYLNFSFEFVNETKLEEKAEEKLVEKPSDEDEISTEQKVDNATN